MARSQELSLERVSHYKNDCSGFWRFGETRAFRCVRVSCPKPKIPILKESKQRDRILPNATYWVELHHLAVRLPFQIHAVSNVCVLLLESATQREMNAIQNEYMSGLQLDYLRYFLSYMQIATLKFFVVRLCRQKQHLWKPLQWCF